MITIIKLLLSDYEYIEVMHSGDNLDDMYLCDIIKIYFRTIVARQRQAETLRTPWTTDKKKKFLLHKGSLHGLESLSEFLGSVIDNKLILDQRIKYNLGYLWNEYCQREDNNPSLFAYHMVEDRQDWIGKNYLVLSASGSTRPMCSVWLYNDEDGNIIFEVTEDYPWTYSEPRQNQKVISYDEFMKNYKSILIRIIPKNIAQQWLKQINELLLPLKEKGC